MILQSQTEIHEVHATTGQLLHIAHQSLKVSKTDRKDRTAQSEAKPGLEQRPFKTLGLCHFEQRWRWV